MRRTRTALLAGVAVGLWCLPAGGPAAAAGPELGLSGARLAADRSLQVIATVPAVLTGEAVPPDAFSASQDGRPVPVASSRVVDDPVELVLVLDVAADAPGLAAEKSAAAELLRSVPPQLPTTLLPGGDRTTARSALGQLADLGPGRVPLLDGLPEAPSVRRLVVVLASCTALEAEQRSITGGDTQVSVLATGAGCDLAAQRVGRTERAVLHTGLAPAAQIADIDEVTRALVGQYVVRTDPGLGDGPVEVTVQARSTVATATVPLPAPQAAPGAAPPARGGRSQVPRAPLVAAAVLAALAAAALVAELLARRPSRRSRPRAAG